MPTTIGKRKRPTGEEMFDVPDSPPPPDDIDRDLGAEKAQSQKKAKVADRDRHMGNGTAAEVSTSVLGSVEANGGAVQQSTTKKRKKRKSIGQQAPRRAKAKSSPAHRKMKPEPVSSPTQSIGEGMSRLSEAPLEGKDPAEAQIRHELAGAAEEGLRDSFVGDTQTTSSRRANNRSKRTSIRQPGENGKSMTRKGPSKESMLEADPHIFSLPASNPADSPGAPLNDESQVVRGKRSEEEENDGDDEPMDVKGHVDIRAPTAKMFSSPAKPKRKKRKSIGQQKPKRPSSTGAGARTKGQSTTGTAATPSYPGDQTKSKPKPVSTTTRKRQQPPAKLTTTTTTTATTTDDSRAPPANSVPITMYRPSIPHHDATEATAESEVVIPEDHDPLTAPLPPAPNTLNSIDVLSQVTRELVAKTASNAQLSARSQRTMQLYGQELESRMKQLGQALATNAALGKRVKAVTVEERDTRRKVKDVISEKEGVRKKIEEAVALRGEMRLGNLLGEISGWVRKGWEGEKRMRGTH